MVTMGAPLKVEEGVVVALELVLLIVMWVGMVALMVSLVMG